MFGMPAGDVFMAQDAGIIDVVIGGCMIDLSGHTHECRDVAPDLPR